MLSDGEQHLEMVADLAATGDGSHHPMFRERVLIAPVAEPPGAPRFFVLYRLLDGCVSGEKLAEVANIKHVYAVVQAVAELPFKDPDAMVARADVFGQREG